MNVTQTNNQTDQAQWFDNLVATLRTHQLQLETDTANEAMKALYDVFMGGDRDEMYSMNKQHIQKHFVAKIIYDYLLLIDQNQPIRLAFDFNDSEVLVWAEVKDDDESAERSLIRAEAKINAKYHQYGFDMETTIVENRDHLAVPNHYRLFKA